MPGSHAPKIFNFEMVFIDIFCLDELKKSYVDEKVDDSAAVTGRWLHSH